MQNAWLDEAWAGIKIAKSNINSLRYANDTILMAESKQELKSLLMKVKEESEKAGLKLNILKMKILVSSPISSWQVDVETTETVTDFIFLGSKILQMVTAAMKLKDTWSLEEKLWPTYFCILKSRNITLPTEVHLVKAIVFPVVVYRY